MIKNAAKVVDSVRSGKLDNVDELLGLSKNAIAELLVIAEHTQSLRNGRLRVAIERVVEAELLVAFFREGKLVELQRVQPCSDEEYIAASLSMAQELSRYCKQRACEVSMFKHSSCAPSS